MEQIAAILMQAPVYIAAVVGVLTAVIGLCMLIPGEQPEKALKSFVDFLSKFSKK